MSTCPACHRPVAVARARCLYCGAELPAQRVTDTVSRPEVKGDGGRTSAMAPSRPRVLLVLELANVSPEALAHGLGLSAYEAALLARRGGHHLHGVLDEAEAPHEVDRLQAAGLTVVSVSEAEVRFRPVRATGGEREGSRVWLRTEEAEVTLGPEDLLIVVHGVIARQYQPSFRRRLAVASLEEGYRVHLHRRFDPRPVELDAANFEFGFAVTGSARLELDAWVDAVAAGVPRDDDFRRLPPAFGVAEPEPRTPLAAAGELARTSREAGGGRGGTSVVLDNVEQFRFYSAWRAALERRRAPRLR